jgi:hypothetical protein
MPGHEFPSHIRHTCSYRVDRQKSVQVLEDFLAKKDAMLDGESTWLSETGADCVLSDAAFLGWCVLFSGAQA